MLNDSFSRVNIYIYLGKLVAMPQMHSSFIDAHDSPFRAANKIADLSTSMRLAIAKRDYTECALMVRVNLYFNNKRPRSL